MGTPLNPKEWTAELNVMRILQHVFAALFAASSASGALAEPNSGLGRRIETLSYVAPSAIPGADGEPLSLCQITRTFHALSVPMWHNAKAYALATNACVTDIFMELSLAEFTQIQSLGLVPQTLPTVPALLLRERLTKAWGLGILALLFGSATFVSSRKFRAHRALDVRARA